MSPDELPPVYQSDLDDATYEALFRDLGALTGVYVTVKRGARIVVEEASSPSLAEARQLLERGEARAIQVRYAHEGVTWSDTILRVPGGFRLVRMAVPA